MGRRGRGITLIELLVALVLLGLIFAPLVRITRSFMEGWWTGRAMTAMIGGGQDALYWAVKDLKNASAAAVGSFVHNGSFEIASDNSTNLTRVGPNPGQLGLQGWNNDADGSLPDNINMAENASTQPVHGYGALSIEPPPSGTVSLLSSTFSIRGSAPEYILSAYILFPVITPGPNPLQARVDLVNEAGNTPVGGTWISTTNAASGTTTWILNVARNTIATDPGPVRIRLQASNPGGIGLTARNGVRFDQVSLVLRRAVLVSTDTNEVNILDFPFDGIMPESAAAPFDSQALVRYRYLIANNGGRTQILRQYQTSPAGPWLDAGYNFTAEDVQTFAIELDGTDAQIAVDGPRRPRRITLAFRRRAKPDSTSWQRFTAQTYVYNAFH